MTDDELTQLASAYLDGEITADERALVEGDERLLDAVGRLRAARSVVRDVEPAPISLRESHLAAALGAWDRIPDSERTGALRDATPRGANAAAVAAAATVSAPPRRSDRRRTTPSTRWLGAAAAALAIVFAGGVALQLTSGDRDDSDTTADLAEESSDDAASSALAADDGAEGGDETGGDAPSAEADVALDDGDAFAADELEATVQADGGELDTGINDAAPPPDTELIVLLTTDDLALFASDAVGAPRSPDVPAATSAPIDLDELSEQERALLEAAFPKCLGVDVIVGPARYGTVEVVVGIDESRDLAIAYVVADCEEIARARLG